MIFLILMAKSFLRLMSELKYTYMHTNLCMCMQISSGLKSGRQGQTLFHGGQWQDKVQWAQTKTQEVSFPYEEKLYFEGDWALVIQESWGVSFSREVQNTQGCDSVQPSLGELALAAGLD